MIYICCVYIYTDRYITSFFFIHNLGVILVNIYIINKLVVSYVIVLVVMVLFCFVFFFGKYVTRSFSFVFVVGIHLYAIYVYACIYSYVVVIFVPLKQYSCFFRIKTQTHNNHNNFLVVFTKRNQTH